MTPARVMRRHWNQLRQYNTLGPDIRDILPSKPLFHQMSISMTEKELKRIEADLEKRGYRKYTTALTSTESYAWFKSFDKEKDEDGFVISGYQVTFRVWDWRPYQSRDKNMPPYGFDFWTSLLGTDSRVDLSANWEPICDIDTFERMAAEFNQMVRKYVK